MWDKSFCIDPTFSQGVQCLVVSIAILSGSSYNHDDANAYVGCISSRIGRWRTFVKYFEQLWSQTNVSSLRRLRKLPDGQPASDGRPRPLLRRATAWRDRLCSGKGSQCLFTFLNSMQFAATTFQARCEADGGYLAYSLTNALVTQIGAKTSNTYVKSHTSV